MRHLELRALACPRDGQLLDRMVAGAVEIPVCPHCRGLWTSNGDLERIRRSGEAWRLPLATEAAGLVDRSESIHCFCRHPKPMRRQAAGGIQWDVCRKCGAIWLDGGEVFDMLQLANPEEEPRSGWEAVLMVLLAALDLRSS